MRQWLSTMVISVETLHLKLIPECAGDHSTLLVSFHLQRHMGDFVIQVRFLNFGAAALVCAVQVYGPCILLVVISWVSFWLNREATSDRISLGTQIQQVQYLFFTIPNG